MEKTKEIPPREQRTEKMSVYVAPSHKELIEHEARKRGISRSSYLLQSALRCADSPEEK